MLRKLTDTVFCDLPPLLAAVFIAMGMPLLHPALHHQSESLNTRSSHLAEQYSVRPDEDHDHWCSICEFLAINQWDGTGPCGLVSRNEPDDNIVSIDDVPRATPNPLQVEPRAPPLLVST